MSYVESNYNIKAIKQCAYICSNSGSQMHIFNKLSRRRIQCKTQRANSGVQRVMDARANEFLGCPQVTNYFPIPIHLPKFLTTFFYSFLTIFTFNSKLLSGCPPLILDAWGPEFYLSYFLCICPSLTFLTFTFTFFHRTPSLNAPTWMPGAVAPLSTPLHATES